MHCGCWPEAPLMIMSFYGWSPGEHMARAEATLNTTRLLEAALIELKEWPHMPCLRMGDLSSQPCHIPAGKWALAHAMLHAVGAIANTWDPRDPDSAPTALAHGSRVNRRIGMAFANCDALRIVKRCFRGQFQHV